jgi:hypothetical protein
MLSGLWHQAQARLQPLKNTVVRSPGPSSVDILWISRIITFTGPGLLPPKSPAD